MRKYIFTTFSRLLGLANYLVAVLLSLLHVKRSTGFISRWFSSHKRYISPFYIYIYINIIIIRKSIKIIEENLPSPKSNLFRLSECRTLLLLLTAASLLPALPELGVRPTIIFETDFEENQQTKTPLDNITSIIFETDFEEKLHKSTDQNTHQVHATVPLTDKESICIISVGPLPYVLYTAGKLVRIIKHCHFDQFKTQFTISRSRSTSFHLSPSSSLCSDLEPGLKPIHVSIAIHRPGWRSGCPPSSWAPRQPASVLLGEKNSSCLTLVQRFHRHVQPDDPQSLLQPQVVDRCLTPDLVTGLSNAKVVKTFKQCQIIVFYIA